MHMICLALLAGHYRNYTNRISTVPMNKTPPCSRTQPQQGGVLFIEITFKIQIFAGLRPAFPTLDTIFERFRISTFILGNTKIFFKKVFIYF